MYIPGDNAKHYRLNKFVEYQNAVPPVHRSISCEWAKRRNLNLEEIIYFSWLMANTYHELTSFMIFEITRNKKNPFLIIKNFWESNKKIIQLGSAKLKAKIQDRFLLPIQWLNREKIKEIEDIFKNNKNSFLRYELCEKYILKAPQFGRFSSDLFLEIIQSFYVAKLFPYSVLMKKDFDWKNCANLTSAVLNIMHEDKLADLFDQKKIKSKKLKDLQPRLESQIDVIENAINKKYGGNKDRSQFVTKLCSFRNLFKSKRYAGFHHDRQLSYLIKYNKDFPEYKKLWSECYDLRSVCYPSDFLGELHNWRGVRPEMKRLWVEKGLTGAENNFSKSFIVKNYELF